MSVTKGPIPFPVRFDMAGKNATDPVKALAASIERPASLSTVKPTGFNDVQPAELNNLKISARKISVVSLPSSFDPSDGAGSTGLKSRKSSFQITSVVNSREGDDAENMEDIDESNQDTSCDIKDISQNSTKQDLLPRTDALRSPVSPRFQIGSDPLPAVESAAVSPPQNRPHGDIHSRFKVVKIISRVRGRWKCLDFAGLPSVETAAQESKADGGGDAESDSVGCCVPHEDSILYVTSGGTNAASNTMQTLVCAADGRLVQLDANPNFMGFSEIIASWPTSGVGTAQDVVTLGSVTMPSSGMDALTVGAALTNTSAATFPAGNRSQSDSAFVISDENGGGVEEDFRTQLGSAMFDGGVSQDESEGRNDVVSSEGLLALDNKIEQAMDLVKSHLMFAVHEEVELLKEQIKELTIKNAQLEMENGVLRASATSQTLAKIEQPRPNRITEFT